MATLTERFPDDIARGAEGGHAYFSTNIVISVGGLERRNANWQDARGEWQVARAIELSGKHQVARSHFIKARGSLHTFRFKDWHDFTASRTGNDKGRLTGATTTWQINKVYGTDEATFEYVRPLKRIVAGSEQIWLNGSLRTRTTHYTIDNDTGIVTSLASWAGGTLEVSCQFDVLTRYNTDAFNPRLLYRLDEASFLFEWANIGIVEARE